MSRFCKLGRKGSLGIIAIREVELVDECEEGSLRRSASPGDARSLAAITQILVRNIFEMAFILV